MRVVGYLDRFSYRPGDEVRCMLSSGHGPVEVDVVRLRHGDTNPAGPGWRAEPVSGIPAQEVAATVQRTFAGSCMVAEGVVPAGAAPLALSVLAWPGLPAAGTPRGLLALADAEGREVAAVALDAEGRLHVRDGGGAVSCRLPRALLERRWYRVTAELGAHRCRLAAEPLQPIPGDADTMRAQGPAPAALAAAEGVVVAALAAPREDDGRRRPVGVYNGKLERPSVAAGGQVLAEWAFEREMDAPRAVDVSGRGRDGLLVNMPARAMRGHGWTGEVLDFRFAPEQYGAIHFHDDDLSDAGWPVSARVALPEDLGSGTYAVRLRVAGDDATEADHVPFVVRPRPGAARASVLLLLPSFTYAAYGNLQPNEDDDPARLHPLDLELQRRPELGKSLYDVHTDGSGVCYASLARPVLHLRPDYRSWLTGAPRHLGADLYLVDWLDEHGIAYDVACDHDLHAEGPVLLDPYQVVLTGSHPEYCTLTMLDALQGHVAAGGGLMYLGGNGFYWVTSQDPEPPHAIEVRRYLGTRTWDGDPGEQNHSTTGEVGGLWRTRGRPPHVLAGIGFTAQGWDASVGYRRTPASRDPRWAWVFEGVDGDVIGDQGLVMGGASGDELDRAEPRWGTPPQTVVLATSLPHSSSYFAVVEEVLAIDGDLSGPASPYVRSDLALVEHPGGGAVFSAGSIAFTGSLSANGYDNGVSRVVRNVLEELLRRGEGE